jgi:hypothetical protein
MDGQTDGWMDLQTPYGLLDPDLNWPVLTVFDKVTGKKNLLKIGLEADKKKQKTVISALNICFHVFIDHLNYCPRRKDFSRTIIFSSNGVVDVVIPILLY